MFSDDSRCFPMIRDTAARLKNNIKQMVFDDFESHKRVLRRIFGAPMTRITCTTENLLKNRKIHTVIQCCQSNSDMKDACGRGRHAYGRGGCLRARDACGRQQEALTGG